MKMQPKMLYNPFKKRFFTLVEMIVVIGIIMLLSGVSIAILVRRPARVILANTASKIEKVLFTAGNQASLQGVQKNVSFDLGSKVLTIGDIKVQDDFSNTEPVVDQKPKDTKNQIKIPKDIEVTFPDFEEEEIQYRFFPDGSASGPKMLLTLEGHNSLIAVSPLTGIVTIKNDLEE